MNSAVAQHSPTLSVGFILSDRFTLTAFASFVDVLRLAADTGDKSRPIRCKWTVLSRDMQPIRASCGIQVHPDARLSDPLEFDYIVVVGGLVEQIETIGPEYTRYLHDAASRRIPLIGLCTGSFILHEAGLMDGYKCCVSWFHRADFLERFAELEPVSDQIFVVDRDRLTCSGGSSAAHLAGYLVEKAMGRRAAVKSLRILIVDGFHSDGKAQPGVPVELKCGDNTVQRALVIMEQEIESTLMIGDIAKRLSVSRRTLEERFRNAVGMSPLQAMNHLRIHHAKQLLQDETIRIAEIAVATGFCDTSHFTRTFTKFDNCTPSTYRLMARQHQTKAVAGAAL